MTPTDAAVTALNRAFAADPDALHALLCNRVPCNRALADDPAVVVDESMVSAGWTVGMLGVINGVLIEAGSIPVAVAFSDQADADGRHKIIGFRACRPAREGVA